MLNSQVKFSADRQTDTGKTICPRCGGYKNLTFYNKINIMTKP